MEPNQPKEGQNSNTQPVQSPASPAAQPAATTKNENPADIDPNLSAFDLLPKSFDIVKKYWKTFVIVNILTLLSGLSEFVPKEEASLSSDTTTLNSSENISGSVVSGFTGLEIGAIATFGIIVIIAVVVLYAFFAVANIVAQTKASRGDDIQTGKILSETWSYLPRVIGLSLLSGIIIVLGLLLLLVPGIIAIARLSLAPYIMVDKNIGIFDAMKQSNAYGKKYFSKIWAVILVGFVVAIGAGIIGAIPFIGAIIGALATIFLSLIMPLRYFQLKKLEGHSATQPSSTAFPVSPAA